MKNQYFGDINDYKKYGLLRSIISSTKLQILVTWMLTEDDGSTDGKFIEYLNTPEKWKHFDQLLYEETVSFLESNEERSVSMIENTNLLYGSQYFSEFVPDHSEGRDNWFSNLLLQSKNVDLVFLDPDNGLEIKSKKYGTKNSSKFLYWHEVVSLWKSGKSLLMYQHFIRENRETFTKRMLKTLEENANGAIVESFSTSNVVFLLALQPNHHIFHQPIVNSVKKSWQGQIKCGSV